METDRSIIDMQKAVTCLALEVDETVHDDVAAKWRAVLAHVESLTQAVQDGRILTITPPDPRSYVCVGRFGSDGLNGLGDLAHEDIYVTATAHEKWTEGMAAFDDVEAERDALRAEVTRLEDAVALAKAEGYYACFNHYKPIIESSAEVTRLRGALESLRAEMQVSGAWDLHMMQAIIDAELEA